MKPEEKARQNIDQLLMTAGWTIQNREDMNLSESQGIAVCEFPVTSGTPDYLLFVDRKVVGVIEAKPEGTTLSGVSDQTEKYLRGVPPLLPSHQKPLPFGYESTGVETFFRDLRDPDSRSRRVFAFHKPDTLAQWIKQEQTLRGKPPNAARTGGGRSAGLSDRGDYQSREVIRRNATPCADSDGNWQR